MHSTPSPPTRHFRRGQVARVASCFGIILPDVSTTTQLATMLSGAKTQYGKEADMVSMQLNGRLGNQMFQYAFARKLWERTGRRGKIRLEFITYGEYLDDFRVNYEKIPYDLEKSSFWKSKFHLAKSVLIALAVELSAARFWHWCAKLFSRKAPDTLVYEHKWEMRFGWIWSFLGLYMARYGYVDFHYPRFFRFLPLRAYGCFECSRYFDDIKPILQEEFSPKEPPRPENSELYSMIAESESVCVTIRRGDYLNDCFRDAFYLCTPEYFIDAMKIMKSRVPNAKFFIFSDEPKWCKENIPFPFECVYESGNDPVWEKLRLMYSCKHFIISNSTFSWWAQYLSRNDSKVVIAPSRWRNGSYTWDIYKDQNWLLYDLESRKLVPNTLNA